jgi:uncharacterized protein (TIGR02300 family)
MTLSKTEKGKKRVCENCSCRWYDLNKNPIICPTCGEKYEIDNLNFGNSFHNQSNSSKNQVSKSQFNKETEVEEISNEEISDNDDDIISIEEVNEEEISN